MNKICTSSSEATAWALSDAAATCNGVIPRSSFDSNKIFFTTKKNVNFNSKIFTSHFYDVCSNSSTYYLRHDVGCINIRAMALEDPDLKPLWKVIAEI